VRDRRIASPPLWLTDSAETISANHSSEKPRSDPYRGFFIGKLDCKSMQHGGLYRRHRELAAHHGAGVEVVVAGTFAHVVQVDLALGIARKRKAASLLEKGLESEVETGLNRLAWRSPATEGDSPGVFSLSAVA
jgi:hypothetical protein